MDFLEQLLSTTGFMPHGHCYAWDSRLILLHVVSDALIALAYYSIPITLIYFVRKRKDLVFDWMFVCFAIFIVACGTTHLMEILNIWYPFYWLAGIIKAITAITSIITAILLIRLVPRALALPSPEQLRQSNEALQKEIRERAAALEKINSLNAELVKQTQKLEEANQELESFGYSVSHDLRTPLRHISGFAELLREECPSLNENATRFLKIITDSTKQLGVLIDNLLEFSRMGRAAMSPQWVDTLALVEQVRQELAQDAAGRDIQWKIDPLPKVYADKTLLKLVWMNLLDNAIKYTRNRAPATISIGSRDLGSEWEFFIKDNGAGFDMNHGDRLFGIFQRLHSKNEFEGTGIGLANVQRIVTRHGGRARAESEVDSGATFFFTLPKGQGESVA